MKIEANRSEYSLPAQEKKTARKTNEDVVKNFLSSWLKSNGCGVYWEKINKYKYPTFCTESINGGTCEKPDLMIELTDYLGNPTYYAIEVKDASSDSNVYDSFPQLLRYAAGNLNYIINDETIQVDGYFTANQYSICGKLFGNDVLSDALSYSEGRRAAINKGELPESEYMITEAYTRLIWRMAKDHHIKNRIGVLLSTALNGARVPAPMVLFSDIEGVAGFQGIEVWHKRTV